MPWIEVLSFVNNSNTLFVALLFLTLMRCREVGYLAFLKGRFEIKLEGGTYLKSTV